MDNDVAISLGRRRKGVLCFKTNILGSPDTWVEACLHTSIVAGDMDRNVTCTADGTVVTPKAALMILQLILVMDKTQTTYSIREAP